MESSQFYYALAALALLAILESIFIHLHRKKQMSFLEQLKKELDALTDKQSAINHLVNKVGALSERIDALEKHHGVGDIVKAVADTASDVAEVAAIIPGGAPVAAVANGVQMAAEIGSEMVQHQIAEAPMPAPASVQTPPIPWQLTIDEQIAAAQAQKAAMAPAPLSIDEQIAALQAQKAAMAPVQG